MIKQMKNETIYEIAGLLLNNFDGNLSLPVKVNFYLQKNTNKIVELGKDIERARMEILNKYGTLNEETQQFTFEPDKVEIVTSELKDLMELTQDVKIYMVDLDMFNDVSLTGKQMSAIEFMINDDEEEDEDIEILD